MSALIRTDKLTKSYGKSRGILDVTFEVQQGAVFGFLGPNGAGKTTTMRTLMGLLRPTSGNAIIGGLDCWKQSTQVKKLVGYLPGEFTFDGGMRGGQIIEYLGHLRGGVDQTYVRKLVERLGFDPTKRFREYSHGNKQKLGLVQAFMHKPRLLILEKLLALIIALLLIAPLMALGTIVGESAANTQLHFGRALLAALNVSLLVFFFAMVALLISQFATHRGTAAGWAGGLMILAFLLDATGRTVSGSWVQYLSPFYYYNLNRPLIPSFNNTLGGAFLLFGLSLLFATSSIVLFAGRDSGGPAFMWRHKHANGNHQVERSLRKAERALSMRTISLRTLRAQGGASFWWLLGIVIWCGWCVLLIPSIQEPLKKVIARSPNLAPLLSGSDIATNAGFLSSVVFAFLPALVVIFAMTLALTWAGDLENGRLELVLGTPQSRQRMVLERFAAIFLLAFLAPVLTWLSIVVGAQIANLSIDQGHVIAASFSLLPPVLIMMGLVYVLAGRLRYSVVLGILTAYITLTFLAEFLKTLLQLPSWLLALSIFHQYGSPITTGMDWGAFIGMTVVAMLLLVLGLVQFRYADIERG